jgi:hypothetical protein
MKKAEILEKEKSINVTKQGYRFITAFDLFSKKFIGIKVSNSRYRNGTWGVNNWYKTREMVNLIVKEKNKSL